MKTKPAFTLLTLFLLTISSGVNGQTKYEMADAVYTDLTHEYVLNPDGSMTYTHEHHLKLLTHFAFDRAYGETFITYNPAWQALNVMTSTTTMADGTKIESPGNAFNEVLPSCAAGSAPYIHLREMVITHTGIEQGASIHLAYRITTKPDMMPGLMGKVVFGDRSPVERMTARVKVPAGKKLYYVLFNTGDAVPDADGTIKTPYCTIRSECVSEDGFDVYTWTATDVTLYSVEPGQPPADQVMPVLGFTTESSFDKFYKHVFGDMQKTFALPEAAKTLVDASVDGKDTYLKKVVAVRNAFEERIGAMTGDIALTGYRAMTADETFARGSGSALDRAVLLAAMLRRAGIEAVPAVCAMMNSGFEEGTHQKSADTALSCKAPKLVGKPQLVYCIPTATVVVICHGRDRSESILVLDPMRHQIGQTKVLSPNEYPVVADIKYSGIGFADMQSMSKLHCALEISKDLHVGGRASYSTYGETSCAFDPPQLAKQARQALQKVMPGIDLEETHPDAGDDPAEKVSFEIKGTAPLKAVNGIISLTIPEVPSLLQDASHSASKEKRDTPLNLPYKFDEAVSYSITLPDNVHFEAGPAKCSIKNSVGSLIIRCTVVGRILVVEKLIELKMSRIPVDKYDEFRTLAKEWTAPDANTIILNVK
jgi:hypothetical protein